MKVAYGSEEDEVCAWKSLSAIELNDHQLKEIVISHFMTKFAKLPEVIYQFIFVCSTIHKVYGVLFSLW